MPDRYEVREFNRSIELGDDEDVVEAQLSAQGTRESSNASNFALVRVPVEADFVCGTELDSGGECQRSVSSPADSCWDHE